MLPPLIWVVWGALFFRGGAGRQTLCGMPVVLDDSSRVWVLETSASAGFVGNWRLLWAAPGDRPRTKDGRLQVAGPELLVFLEGGEVHRLTFPACGAAAP